MPTRFMLIYGADDSKLQHIDDHPDCADGEKHKINVENLRKGLKLLGYKVAETGPYDDEVQQAHVQYLSLQSTEITGDYDEEIDESGKEFTDLKISLDVDPDDPAAQDDTFTLYSSEAVPKYKQTKTVKDDADKSNNTLELVFTKVDTALVYTLEIDPGKSGEKEYPFKNKPFGQWR
jgi:hypothetical protein